MRLREPRLLMGVPRQWDVLKETYYTVSKETYYTGLPRQRDAPNVRPGLFSSLNGVFSLALCDTL
jgi:hypothetical protein